MRAILFSKFGKRTYILLAISLVLVFIVVSFGSSGTRAAGNIVAVAAGTWHSCALTDVGGVKCWGRNHAGQLGDGTNTNSSIPVDVAGLGNGVVSLDAGSVHTCAVTVTGGVKCWGMNSAGQIGTGVAQQYTTPADVIGLQTGVATVVTGNSFTCALLQSGAVKCWGTGPIGQPGHSGASTPEDVSALGTSVSSLSAGPTNVCAALKLGGMKCWGGNSGGQIGDYSFVTRMEPATVVGINEVVTSMSVGEDHVCAIAGSSNLYCWGYNRYGATTMQQQASNTTAELASWSNPSISMVSGGQAHNCALFSGWVGCWGWNALGQLGDGTTISINTARHVLGIPGDAAVYVDAGAANGCAVSLNALVYCWGNNEYGQLGDGTNLSSRTAVQVVGLEVPDPTPTPTPTDTPISTPTPTETPTPTPIPTPVIYTCNGQTATIAGTEGPDVINGTAIKDVIVGLGGNDEIHGLQGDDVICGGLDDDNIYGDDGNDVILGDAGTDTLYGGIGNDRMYGNDGNDQMFGDVGNDTLQGDNGDDTIWGGANNDSIQGNADNDTIYGEDGIDFIGCGTGIDSADGGLGVDSANGTCETVVSIP